MYERADIIFVVARSMVSMSLYVLQVLHHMAENHVVVVAKCVFGGINLAARERATAICEAAGESS